MFGVRYISDRKQVENNPYSTRIQPVFNPYSTRIQQILFGLKNNIFRRKPRRLLDDPPFR